MAYQNVGRPRFFIDNYQYLRAIGLDTKRYFNRMAIYDQPEDNQEIPYTNYRVHTPFENEDIYTLYADTAKLSSPELHNANSVNFHIPCGFNIGDMDFSGNMKWYGAILNHNIGYCIGNFSGIHFNQQVLETSYFDIDPTTSILNCTQGERMQNGSSIFFSANLPNFDMYDDTFFTGFRIHTLVSDFNELYIGGISMGVMYTMPHSPDLSVSMEIEFDGYDKIETLGGSTLTNIRQTGAPVWFNPGQPIRRSQNPNNNRGRPFHSTPFSVDSPNFTFNPSITNDRNALFNRSEAMHPSLIEGSKRNGRRNWSLKFSLISDNDLFSSNYMKTNTLETSSEYESSDILTDFNEFDFNMFTDDSFIAQVWNKTLGGALPFIFQPDSENNNPDQFCIAEFDQDSLKVTQTAFRTYSFSVKIREVW
mgnify:CR=1 FL=1|tara:strand:+ start:231 stop:1493 length:1263 start_codon:yes stop_codon:yes gene_type:complete